MPALAHPSTAISKFIGSAAGLYAFVGGLLSLSSWAFGVAALADWWGTGIAVKANTAVASSMAGVALVLCAQRIEAPRLLRCLSVVTFGIGAATLLQHALGVDFGIDTLLFEDTMEDRATAAPGRMGPPASLSFSCLGLALIMRTFRTRHQDIETWLAIFVLAISSLSLIGYWYGAEPLYSVPSLTGIAVQTSTILAALSIGLIATRPDREPMKTLLANSNAGVLARTLLPIALVVPILIGWGRLLGLRAGYYDSAFGTALRTLVEIAILGCAFAWIVQIVRNRDDDRARIEDDRRSLERRLLQTMAFMTDGFVTLDRDWRFDYANAEAERIMGKNLAQMKGKALAEVFPQLVDTPLHAQLMRVHRDRLTVEADAVDGEGEEQRHFRFRIYPNRDGGLAVYFQDDTLRHRAENALREANRMKDELLAVLSHELRNPLAPVRTAATLLSRQATDPVVRKSTAIIERQVTHMARLLDDLLDISRLTRSRLELRMETLELSQIVHSAIEIGQTVIETRGHALKIALPPTPIHVVGDAVRLTQMLSNILINAAKYTPNGGCIELSVSVSDDACSIRVVDNGIGILANTLPRIFDMFSQASRSGVEKDGLGLGLFIAKSIAELHGGSIVAHSAGADQGSEFIIRLPANR